MKRDWGHRCILEVRLYLTLEGLKIHLIFTSAMHESLLVLPLRPAMTLFAAFS